MDRKVLFRATSEREVREGLRCIGNKRSEGWEKEKGEFLDSKRGWKRRRENFWIARGVGRGVGRISRQQEG